MVGDDDRCQIIIVRPLAQSNEGLDPQSIEALPLKFLPRPNKKEVRVGTVNALGEGRVWVSNSNGEIEAGDYLTTSIIP